MKLNYKHYYYTALVLVVISLSAVYYFAYLNNTPLIETFSHDSFVILMGDSILNNNNYVNIGQSVGDLLQKLQGNVIIVAEDEARIHNLGQQFKKVPNNANKKSTRIILSVGGNDILNHYLKDDINNIAYVDTIFNKYTSMVNNMRNNCECEFILCNIYYPRSRNYVKYFDIIQIWNKKIAAYAKQNRLKVLELDSKINDGKYFTHDIEPSHSGGKIITKNILNFV
jgi:hypothetical protein